MDRDLRVRRAILIGIANEEPSQKIADRVMAELDWQLIETAPQDGRKILTGRFVGCALDWARVAWRKAGLDPGTSWRMRGGVCDPTHWIDVPVTREMTNG